jgi:acetylornithine deacetylase/succinyl-diaminopimelate desuccinylase-like protein
MTKYSEMLAKHKDSFLEDYFSFLRFPSVSADPAFANDLASCANWLAETITKLGGHAEQIRDGGRPVVYGEFSAGRDKPTILLYGHYDVQPATDTQLWYGDPFQPTLKNDRLFGRGVADDKGPIMMGLCGIKLLQAAGKLPVNIKVVFEGEEESTGQAIFNFVQHQPDRLKCDLVLCTDASAFSPSRPAINYATRGIVYKEITVHGPSHDLHSGSYGGPVQPPTNALALILAGLFDANGKITIPGVYDRVLPISPEEHAAFSKLDFDLDRYKQHVGVSELIHEDNFSVQEQNWCRPNLCINGLVGGYSGEGPKTVLPAWARAKISLRLVPNQIPEEISELLEKRIRDLTPPGVSVEIKSLGLSKPFLGPRSGPAIDAMNEASLLIYGRQADLTREGGTIPILTHFAQYLTPNILNIGLTGTECNTHGPNENIVLDLFFKGIEMNALLLEILGKKLHI